MYHTATMRWAYFFTFIFVNSWSFFYAYWTTRSRSEDPQDHLPQGGDGHASSVTSLFFVFSLKFLLVYGFLYRKCLRDLMTYSRSVIGWHLATVRLCCVYDHQLQLSRSLKVQQVTTCLFAQQFAAQNLRQRFDQLDWAMI